jgi:hypothetical protein
MDWHPSAECYKLIIIFLDKFKEKQMPTAVTREPLSNWNYGTFHRTNISKTAHQISNS